jgi:hypothetical protein
MHTAIEMQHFAETGARLPAATMAATRPMLLDQPGGLQCMLHEAV